VQEMIRSGEQGILTDFFDPDSMARQVDALLQDPLRRDQLSQRARQSILDGGYDLETCLQRQLALVDRVMAE